MSTKVLKSEQISNRQYHLFESKKSLKTAKNGLIESKDSGAESSQDSSSTVNLYSSTYARENNIEQKPNKKRFYLQNSQYVNGESVMAIGAYPKDNSEYLKPRQVGDKIIQKGLSRRQASKIRRAVRQLHFIAPNNKLSFLTLTYGADYPKDLTAKKHLDKFFKQVRYNHFDNEKIHYVWVAEKQKRGAIHYHIVLVDYIPKKVIDKAWQGIVSKWQKQNGFEQQDVYPNIKGISESENIQKYLSKNFKRIGGYLTAPDKQDTIQEIEGNIWGCSSLTRSLCKAERDRIESDDYKELESMYLDRAAESQGVNDIFEHFIEDSGTKILIITPKPEPEQSAEQAPEQSVEPIQWFLTPIYSNDIDKIQDDMVNALWI